VAHAGGGEGRKASSHCVNLLTLRAILGGFGLTAHRTAHVIGSSSDNAAGNIAKLPPPGSRREETEQGKIHGPWCGVSSTPTDTTERHPRAFGKEKRGFGLEIVRAKGRAKVEESEEIGHSSSGSPLLGNHVQGDGDALS
jgi:hypothetical protein